MSTAVIIGASVAAATLIGLAAFSWSGLTIDKSTPKANTTVNTSDDNSEQIRNQADLLSQYTGAKSGKFTSFSANGSQDGGRRKSKSKRCKSRKRKGNTKKH